MPTYQYACTECGHQFEQVQSFSDASLTVCPVCSGKLRKVFNAVGVVFKGSGFYRNDSRSTSVSSDTAAPSSSTASESKDSGGSKDSGTKKESSTPAPAKDSSSSSSSSSSSKPSSDS